MASYNKNLAAVVEHLDEGETIIASCGGLYKAKVLGTDSVRKGILLATEKRVVFFGKKFGGDDLESFPLSNVSAIEMSKHWFSGPAINMKMSGNTAEVTHLNEGDPDAVVKYVRDHMGESSAAPVAAPVADDIPAQIQKLASLKDAGILTEEEFTTKKAELLAKM